ncbi:MAG: metallophosphoesterase family protein [Bacteroidota bacterium]|jgi:putative phosphoesterase|nr:metallophosphatase family protein [Sphingobacteriales bacterium]
MKRVGILSDTHGYLHPYLFTFFKECDELWHAGDWGNMETIEKLEAFKSVRGVWGNIDDRSVRMYYPEVNRFEVEGLEVCMLHIGGYPGSYSRIFKQQLQLRVPDIMVCGHSHILKVMKDPKNGLMHFNPGAAGNKGFHQVCTAIRLRIDNKKMFDMEVWEHQRNKDATL